MTNDLNSSVQIDTVAVGDELPVFDLALTSTMIVAGAIASRDFMPAHHDPEFARGQGAPDIFMNILTTNGYVARFISDWAGPEAMIRKIAIRLGAPAIPGQTLRFTGQVTAMHDEQDEQDKQDEQDEQDEQDKQDKHAERVIEVAVRAANELGDHATGTVVVTLPTT